jgi:endonuclease/exonuclease/phosphatase family metal-dependent hydrolase
MMTQRLPKHPARRWLPALLLALAAACAAPRTAPAPAAPLRVLVYNIHAGKDAAGVGNLERVAALVAESRADVALLQEVDRLTTRSGRVDQIAELARRTGYHAAFGKTLDYQGGEYGIAILSRWPITADSLVRLPVQPAQERAGGSYEPRGLLHATVARPTGALHVLNTHLDASGDDHYRRQEIATVLRLAGGLRESGALAVFGGDLNARPESAVLDTVRAAGWRDAWDGCGTGAGETFPAHAPDRRIDYLIVPGGVRCDSAAVLATDASDHRPVLFILTTSRSNDR